MDNPVGFFPCGAELSLGRVSGCRGDLAQDEVSYIKSFELLSLVVVLGHLLMILCHLVEGFVSHFIQTIQVDL